MEFLFSQEEQDQVVAGNRIALEFILHEMSQTQKGKYHIYFRFES